MLDVFSQLGPQDYELFATPDPRSAIRQAYDLQPDAVLMVVDNPQANEWAASLQALRSLSSVPIIALANSVREADRQRVIETGVDACYLQPFDGQAVAAQLDVLTWPGRAAQRGAVRTGRWA
ncbi:MAG: response regulator transcription factor [Chloroflexi bacterium]|nr:response regulator transcription factor [Chloroflexota bacterium]